MANNYLKLRCKCGNDNGGFSILAFSYPSWETSKAHVDALNAYLLEHLHGGGMEGQDQWFLEYASTPDEWVDWDVQTYPTSPSQVE